MNDHFHHLIITGRAASGKSEFLDFLKRVPVPRRLELYHIGEFKEVDDFLWIWEMGETDDLWEKLGKKRRWTKNVGVGYVESDGNDIFWEFLDIKLNRTLTEKYLNNTGFYKDNTLFVEFARGGRDGYRRVLNALDGAILKDTAIFFINNTFEESVRRNNARYEAKKKYSILAHKTPDEVMEGYYKFNDWDELCGGRDEGYLNIKGVNNVPFVSVWNIPEVTAPADIEARFAPPLKRLWELYKTL
jgi:hypothetical protein